MSPEERNKFLYATRVMLPKERKEVFIDLIERAQALMEQELILDRMYAQMDYKSMNAYESDKYKKGINKLSEVMVLFGGANQ